ALLTERWPGNVRELKNTIERAAHLAPGPAIEPADLYIGRRHDVRRGQTPPRASEEPPAGDDEELYDAPFKEAKQSVLDAFERRYFERLIARTDNNLSRAAAEAGITRYYLRELLKRHGLHRPPESPAAAAATSPRSS
ncbi:MAG: hypothetical protein KC636_15555, partial [Myxococcales bacterium]|nr:hypothetical protein [Myxococcales bacterium]